MRKLLPLLTLLFTCICSLLAQDTTLFNYDYYRFSYNSKTREMSITGTDREVDAHYYISMGTIPKKYTPVRIVIGNDSLTVVYFHKHKKNCSLYTQSFSKVDLHPTWNVRRALAINSKKGTYYTVVTPDGSKCALAFWYRNKNKEPFKLKAAVVNGSGKKLYEYEYLSNNSHNYNTYKLPCYGLKDGTFYFRDGCNELYHLDSSGIHYYTPDKRYTIYPHTQWSLILPNCDLFTFGLGSGSQPKYKVIYHFDYNQKKFFYLEKQLDYEEKLNSSFDKMRQSNSPKQENLAIHIKNLYELSDHSYVAVFQASGRSYKEKTVTNTWKDKDGKTHTTTNTVRENVIEYWGDILIEQISPDFQFGNYYIVESYVWAKTGNYGLSTSFKDDEIIITHGLNKDNCIIRKNAEGGLDIIKIDPDAAPTPEEESEKFKTMDESPEFDD